GLWVNIGYPLDGLVVNIGFIDGFELTEILSEAFTKGRLIGHISTLDKYQRERKRDNPKMLAVMKTCNVVFASAYGFLQS
ncbi:2-octaprenyl-3-methyl-6-methoxy-1,4-benzoquinol hydroxylase, partial [Francisella tularensis subsp. holarctica]|nr:2-octaprenyl-3-methyl-6-methoxy-1,4-benzoquinol hydroxylase [Francisella tularensis subsp. holarctica]